MTRSRPIAGALVASLMSLPGLAAAAPVLNLTPPHAGLVDPKPIDNSFVTQLTGASGGTTYSPAEVDVQPTLQTRHFGARAELTCKVAGTPNDLVVINSGLEPLPSGTRIKWQLRSAGEFGFFALLNELPSGESLVADDVLAGGADKGADCVARVI